MLRKPTLKDVATTCGVSSASVSMILNGKSLNRFSPDTVTTVVEAARAMGYRGPSTKSETPRQIAIISPSVMNPYHTSLIMGIEQEAFLHGYHTTIHNTYWNPNTERYILDTLDHSRIAGVIFVMMPLEVRKAQELNRRIPVVAVGDRINELGIDTVDINNFNAARQVARHLIGLGHRHIAYVTTAMNDHHVARVRRREGLEAAFREECPEGGISIFCKDNPYEKEILIEDIEYLSGRELAGECMKNPRITAIVAINDMVAYGVLDALMEAGRKVPEEYSLCGFDNVFPSGLQRMQLTTVEHFIKKHGGSAFRLLLEKMTAGPSQEEGDPVTRVEYQSRLIIRDSTGRPRTA